MTGEATEVSADTPAAGSTQGSAPGFRVFLNYRRDDAAGHAGRLYDSLIERFGQEHVFMDVDAIHPGADYGEVINKAVGSCDVLPTTTASTSRHATAPPSPRSGTPAARGASPSSRRR